MKYLIYTEVPLNSQQVQDRLAYLNSSATVTAMVPVRELSPEELHFLETEQTPQHEGFPAAEIYAGLRLRDAIDALTHAGFENIDGVIVNGSPVDEIEAAIEAQNYAVVVMVTEPVGIAGWVHLDLAHRLERHIDEPVVHIELQTAQKRVLADEPVW